LKNQAAGGWDDDDASGHLLATCQLSIWSRKRSSGRQGKDVRGPPAWTDDLLLLRPFACLDFLYKRDRICGFLRMYKVLSEGAAFDVGEEERRNLML
jgi:hypothetical protein